MEQISLIISLIFGIFIIAGVIIGLIRGLTKSLIRLIFLVIIIVLSLLFAGLITPGLTDLNIPALNLSVNDVPCGSIKEYISLSVAGNSNISPEQVGSFVDFLVAIVALFLNSIIFALMFLVFKLGSLPVYRIVNGLLSKVHNGKKRVLFGGLVGLFSGLIVALTLMTPFVGYASIYKDASQKLVADGVVKEEQLEQIDQVVDSYNNSYVVKATHALKLDTYSMMLFNAVSRSKHKDTTFVLANEKEAILNAVPALIKIKDATSSEGEQNIAELAELITPLLDSDIAFTALKEFAPILAASFKDKEGESTESGNEIYDLLSDMINNIPKLSKEQVKRGVSSIVSFVEEVKNINENNSTDYGKLGKQIDNLIADEILSADKINAFATSFAENILGGITEENDFSKLAESIIDNLKKGITSYEKELTAVGKVLELKDTLSGEFSFEENGVELGAKIDDIIAVKAELINKSLIDNFIGDIVLKSLSGNFSDSAEEIKRNLVKVRSYEAEFKYISKAKSLSTADFSIGNLTVPDENGKTLGDKLDEIAPSVIIGRLPLKIIEEQLDNYSNENSDYLDIFSVVKANYTAVSNMTKAGGINGRYTYSDLTSAFEDFYNSISGVTTKITDCDNLKKDAANYDKTLAELQNNILLGEKGARQIAYVVATDVKAYVERAIVLPVGTPSKLVNRKKMLIAKIDNYTKYLSRNDNLSAEPYNDDSPNVFADDDGKTYTADGNLRFRVNKPFSYFAELLDGLLILLDGLLILM